MTDNLFDLMKVDPLAEAEKITGQSYKDDNGTMSLGFAMHMLHNDRVRAAAEASGDTHYNSTFEQALAVFLDLDFDVVLEDHFEGSNGAQETYLVLWNEDGVLGTLESHEGTRMNSAKIYYNVMSGVPLPWDVTSSGSYAVYDADLHAFVWAGDHDVRTGFRASFSALQEAGTFLPRWVKRPHLGLVAYREWHDLPRNDRGYPDYRESDKIREERILRLPEHVRKAILR